MAPGAQAQSSKRELTPSLGGTQMMQRDLGMVLMSWPVPARVRAERRPSLSKLSV